jgi:hypothetical protein
MSDRTLKEQITAEPTRSRVVAECVTLIDQQVKSKTGLKAMALKGAYGAIKTIKRGFVKSVVEALLDEWVDKLEPYYGKWDAAGTGSFADYLTSRSDDVAEELLQVTDARAETTKHKTAKKYYFKMRDKAAKENVVEAIPELSKLLERHLDRNAPADDAGDGDTAASA